MIRTTPMLLLVTTVILLTSLAQGQSVAVPASRTINVKVKFGDLDLGNQEDARILYSRLEKAAKKACNLAGFSPYRRAIPASIARRDYQACIATTLADVVTRLNAPRVSRLLAEFQMANSVEVASR